MNLAPPSRTRVKKRSEKMGLSPGSLVAVGDMKSTETKVSVIQFDATSLEERTLLSCNECALFKDSGKIAWINVEGIADLKTIETIGTTYGLHPLVLEDLVNTTIRPKQEDHDSYIVTILKMIMPSPDRSKIGRARYVTEQVSIVIGANWVLTFQEVTGGDVFERVRERLRGAKGRLRSLGADYLAYCLMDAIVDGYFVVLEDLGEQIDKLEHDITTQTAHVTLNHVHEVRRFALSLRRSIWPVRDIIAGIERDGSRLISPTTNVYFRDVYDHAVEIMDMLEAYRETVGGLMELYLSSNSNRMNSIMMMLTVVTSIFMPLTFIVGIYGMNFEHMPELKWIYGYPMIMALMAVIALGMLAFFRKRRWI